MLRQILHELTLAKHHWNILKHTWTIFNHLQIHQPIIPSFSAAVPWIVSSDLRCWSFLSAQCWHEKASKSGAGDQEVASHSHSTVLFASTMGNKQDKLHCKSSRIKYHIVVNSMVPRIYVHLHVETYHISHKILRPSKRRKINILPVDLGHNGGCTDQTSYKHIAFMA